MSKVNEVQIEVLTPNPDATGSIWKSVDRNKPTALKLKQFNCEANDTSSDINEHQECKHAAVRHTIGESLQDHFKKRSKSLMGKMDYRKLLIIYKGQGNS